MNLELVTIGTELLLGFTVDTNGAFAGKALARAGVRVVRRTSVGDEPAAIADAVRGALARTRAVLTTGGLGPTRDDMTKKVIAKLFGAPLDFDESIWNALLERYARFKRTPSESNRSQAEVPRNATVLPNRWGTAPGLWLEGQAGLVIMLPGVPLEMQKLLDHEVVPRLAARAGETVIMSSVVRTTAVAESNVAERVKVAEDEIAPLTLAYLPGLEGVDLRLTAWNLSRPEAETRLATAAMRLKLLIGDNVYGEQNDDLAALLLDRCRKAGIRVAVAESCTGGIVGQRITAVPGCSAVFVGGVIAYSNELKRDLLGVSTELLARHGAVSAEVAEAMARGAIDRFHVEAAVSVTGIAGPDGGTEEKPVGTVWFAFAIGAQIETVRAILPGTREEIRERAAQYALYGLWLRLPK